MTQDATDNTRERLLDHAERLFALKGFEAVSIREITREAESNLAAVNYHFGSKMNLYLEVFRQRWAWRTRRIREDFNRLLADKPEPDISEVIEAMALAFLDGPLSDMERRHHVLLMQRELARPGEALKMVVEEVMHPYQKQLIDLLRPNLPPDVSDGKLRLCILSILGMTLYFSFARPAVSLIMKQEYDEAFKARLIQHITTFSLNGINALTKET